MYKTSTDVIIEALTERVNRLEMDCFMKDREIERLKLELSERSEIEKRPSTKKAEEIR